MQDSREKNPVMKILMMSNMYPSITCPRYGIFVKNFQASLEKEGARFPHIVVITDSPIKSGISKFWSYLQFHIKAVVRIIQGGYDLVYVHYPLHIVLPILILLFLKRKVVLNFHGDDLIFDTRIKKLLAPCLRVATRKAKQIVVPSVFFKQKVQEVFNIPERKIYVSPSGGIDSTKFRRLEAGKIAALKQQYHIASQLVLGFIANFITGKGWKIFLQACAELARRGIDFKAIMIGDGPDKPQIIAEIAALDLKDKTILIPAMPQEQVGQYYSLFDLFLFPTYQESLGLVGLEAMACGTPVIASNLEGPATYIESGVNGILFEPGNHLALVDAVLSFIKLSKERKEMLINNAYETTILFDTKKVAAVLYQQLLQVAEA